MSAENGKKTPMVFVCFSRALRSCMVGRFLYWCVSRMVRIIYGFGL
jgi:hypothetical protein